MFVINFAVDSVVLGAPFVLKVDLRASNMRILILPYSNIETNIQKKVKTLLISNTLLKYLLTFYIVHLRTKACPNVSVSDI